MISSDSSQQVRLQRTDRFLGDDDMDAFFVSKRTSRAGTCAATTLFALLLCAILSLI